MNNSKLVSILDSIQDSIKRSDEKASSLLTAVGIIFSLSFLSLDTIVKKASLFINVVFIIYIITFLLCIVCLLIVIFPRGKKSLKQSL